ncbi:hypothetical protein X727_33415 [Mesorhizobium sp. L103C119B0]|nr:hypothetical protein X727_33415 [Mesorhizobium sp. L103C119B0]
MHGTTGVAPAERFAKEVGALRPLGGRAPFGQLRDLVRKVQADCAIDLDTNCYSAPWRLIGESVQVVVLGGRVIVRHAGEVVADHALCRGRRQRIVDRAHLPAWSALLDEAARSEMTLREALAFLVTREIARRDERRISMASKIAQFPFVRELDGYDFDAQPSLDQPRSGNWRPAAGSPMATTRSPFLGPPGTGKTHLAVSLGREAIRQNYSVQFVTAATLVAMLAKAHGDGALEKQLTTLSRPKLLIIDELGYLPFEANAAHLDTSNYRRFSVR